MGKPGQKVGFGPVSYVRGQARVNSCVWCGKLRTYLVIDCMKVLNQCFVGAWVQPTFEYCRVRGQSDRYGKHLIAACGLALSKIGRSNHFLVVMLHHVSRIHSDAPSSMPFRILEVCSSCSLEETLIQILKIGTWYS